MAEMWTGTHKSLLCLSMNGFPGFARALARTYPNTSSTAMKVEFFQVWQLESASIVSTDPHKPAFLKIQQIGRN